eukprot:356036-Chlamydomonas_euryale.AAC.1
MHTCSCVRPRPACTLQPVQGVRPHTWHAAPRTARAHTVLSLTAAALKPPAASVSSCSARRSVKRGLKTTVQPRSGPTPATLPVTSDAPTLPSTRIAASTAAVSTLAFCTHASNPPSASSGASGSHSCEISARSISGSTQPCSAAATAARPSASSTGASLCAKAAASADVHTTATTSAIASADLTSASSLPSRSTAGQPATPAARRTSSRAVAGSDRRSGTDATGPSHRWPPSLASPLPPPNAVLLLLPLVASGVAADGRTASALPASCSSSDPGVKLLLMDPAPGMPAACTIAAAT